MTLLWLVHIVNLLDEHIYLLVASLTNRLIHHSGVVATVAINPAVVALLAVDGLDSTTVESLCQTIRLKEAPLQPGNLAERRGVMMIRGCKFQVIR